MKWLVFLLVYFPSIILAQNWTRVEGGMTYDIVRGLAVDNTKNAYTIGSYSSGFDTVVVGPSIITKYDSSGGVGWVWGPDLSYGGGALSQSLDNDQYSNLYFTGYLMDSVKIGDSIYTSNELQSNEFFIGSIDSSGSARWAIRAVVDTPCWGFCNSYGREIHVSNNDFVYASFWTENTIYIGNDTVIWTNPTKIVKLDTAGTVVWIRNGGYQFGIDSGDNYYYSLNKTLVKYDDLGNQIWSEILPDSIQELLVSEWNHIYLTTADDLYKIDELDGSIIWSIPVPTYHIHGLSANSTGDVVLTGALANQGSLNYFVDNSGAFTGHFNWGNPTNNHNTIGKYISLSEDGYIYLVGELAVTSAYPNSSSFVFGNDTISNNSNGDTYISRIRVSDWMWLANIAQNQAQNQLLIYPNPTSGVTTITNGEQGITNIEVYDIFGRPVPFHFDIGRSLLDIRSSPPGVYFVRVGQAARKLILHR